MTDHRQLSRGKKLDLLLQVLELCIAWFEPRIQTPQERHPERTWFPLGNSPYISGDQKIVLEAEVDGLTKYATSGWEQSGSLIWDRDDRLLTFEVGFGTSFQALDPDRFPPSDFLHVRAKVQYEGLWPWFTFALNHQTGKLTLVETKELQAIDSQPCTEH